MRATMKPIFRTSLFCGLLLAAGCPGSGTYIVVDGAAGSVDGQGNGDGNFPTLYICDAIDILFVIDNSDTMSEEQQNLVANFPQFIKRIDDIEPTLTSYHVGVISTDLGAGPYEYQGTGPCLPGGDQGKLQHQASGASGCAASYTKFLQGPKVGLAADFACVAELGHTGCGFEQPMESALKALTDQAYNEGFLRANAPLAIIFIADEDDCSAADTTLYDPDDAAAGALPSRCITGSAKLHPISRYVQAFSSLKDNAKRLVVAAITGPAGVATIDPLTNKVNAACQSSRLGSATPGNRFAELVQAFGEQGVQQSICQDDLAQALDVVGQAVARACVEVH
jgi:hypothetical protein